MKLEVSKELFGPLWEFIEDDKVTDIKWNGTNLWINDLTKGRYLAKDIILEDNFLKILLNKIANSVNENFNISKPSLKAETDELRIQAEHNSISGDDKLAFAIRKTPSVSRLKDQNLVREGYIDHVTNELLPCLMHSRLSGIITGDVGSGKTELEKYLVGFIKDEDGIISVEDTLEMKLKKIYPDKDIYSMKVSDGFDASDAIKDALRLMTKWIILSEARGREVIEVIEGASTGCSALTSIHAENVWEIPDRIMNMAKDYAHKGFENDIYTFFDYAIKVKADITKDGIKRKIDQICFFDRNNKVNSTVMFMLNGKLTKNPIPERILYKFMMNNEKKFLSLYKDIITG